MPIPLSIGTRAFKLLFPVVAVVLAAESVHIAMSSPDEFGLLAIAAWTVSLVMSAPWVYRARDVYATDDGLRVRDRGDLIDIPYAEIASIREIGSSSPPVVIVKLHGQLAFGDTITFFAKRMAAGYLRARSQRLVQP